MNKWMLAGAAALTIALPAISTSRAATSWRHYRPEGS